MDKEKFILEQLAQHREYIEQLHERLQLVEGKLHDALRALEFIQRNNTK